MDDAKAHRQGSSVYLTSFDGMEVYMIPVLVVDDEKFVREGIVRGTDWKSVGCEVVGQAKNGEEALALARTLHPALIVTDIRMPKMDGIELVRTLREENIAVKVIFLTAYSDFSYAQQAIRLKASDYLLKPFEDGQLEAVVKRSSGRRSCTGSPRHPQRMQSFCH